MVTLFPRLPGPAAEILLDQNLARGFDAGFQFNPTDLPEAVRFAATGGSRVSPTQLSDLRDRMLKIARTNGFGNASVHLSHAKFDAEMAASLAEDALFASGEALRDDVWTFVGAILAPDIVHWRFGDARQRYLGGVRNTFQRLWMRGRALDRGTGHRKRWQLLEELTEDALVQITERPSLGGDPALARAIAEAWHRASLHHGRRAMEPIMRRAALRVRIWNEIRSLAEVPSEKLSGLLDCAFDMPSEQGGKSLPAEACTSAAEDAADGLIGSDGNTSHLVRTKKSKKIRSDATPTRSQAATRVLDAAKQRGWISRKSFAALSNLQKGELVLSRRQRNALIYLLKRMRAAAILSEEVSLLWHAITLEPSSSIKGNMADPPSSTRKSRSAMVRAR